MKSFWAILMTLALITVLSNTLSAQNGASGTGKEKAAQAKTSAQTKTDATKAKVKPPVKKEEDEMGEHHDHANHNEHEKGEHEKGKHGMKTDTSKLTGQARSTQAKAQGQAKAAEAKSKAAGQTKPKSKPQEH